MRPALLLSLLLLPACEAVLLPAVAVNGAALVVTGRTVPDLLVSAATGRDCSLARLDGGETYCRPEPAAPPPLRCTRSLGTVDCWDGPVPGHPPPRGVADHPPAPTPRPWPASAL